MANVTPSWGYRVTYVTDGETCSGTVENAHPSMSAAQTRVDWLYFADPDVEVLAVTYFLGDLSDYLRNAELRHDYTAGV